MGFDNVPLLSGLFYIISTKEKQCGLIETVLSWNHFWGTNNLQQPSFTPFSYNTNNVFEYLEMFEINNPTFYSQCQNNNMDLKLWEKKENSFKELLSIPVKLHPFFDSFNNPKNVGKFCEETIPVVSSTDWIEIRVGSAVEPILCGKIQVTLAIGTVEQLSTFKANRNITVHPSKSSKSSVNDNPVSKKANPTALADMLSSFIDNLALSLPKRSESDQYATDQRYQLRRTSDLLDVLHSALKNPAPVNLITSSSPLPSKMSGRATSPQTNSHQEPEKKNIRVVIHIHSARNLTRKENTQVSYSNDSQNTTLKNDRFSTYVSFDAIEEGNNGQCSTFATKIVQNFCNPNWNEKFNVQLPSDLVQKENKFILNIWRKFFEQEEIIGVVSIDLSLLSSGSSISGHYNILNSSGQITGQLKIDIVPTGDIRCEESSICTIDEAELPNDFIDLENGSYNIDNIILSRTLKRKFTELEEISQRLKSRLLDVTADDDNFDMDDEFENDLNTCPIEDDMDVNGDFDWNRFSTLEIDCGGANVQLDKDIKSVEPIDLATAFNHTALNVSHVDAEILPADGDRSMSDLS